MRGRQRGASLEPREASRAKALKLESFRFFVLRAEPAVPTVTSHRSAKGVWAKHAAELLVTARGDQ